MSSVRHPRATPPGPSTAVDGLFVYGSLRLGHSARGLVEPFVREWEPATVRGGLYGFASGYPAVVLEPGAGLVMGELLRLQDVPACLAALDEYEGADYRRELVQVDHVGGPTWAWIYVLADPRAAALGTPVPGGEWMAAVTGDSLDQRA